MQNTKVVNIRTEACDVYIGRGSIFGNMFKLNRDGNREEVIAKYKEYFYHKVNIDAEFRAAVLSLRGKRLGCYCKPLACHGDVIVEYLNNGGAE